MESSVPCSFDLLIAIGGTTHNFVVAVSPLIYAVLLHWSLGLLVDDATLSRWKDEFNSRRDRFWACSSATRAFGS